MQLRIRGKMTTGQETLDRAISDLEYVDGGPGPMLVSVSGPEGGIVSYSLRDDRMPQQEDQAHFVAGQVSGAGHDLIVSEAGGQLRVYVTGVMVDGIVSYGIGSGGDIGGRFDHDGAVFGASPAVGAGTDSGDFLLADPAQPGFSVFGLAGDGALVGIAAVSDTAATHADAIGVMAAVRVGGADVVVVASQSEYGVTAYRVGSGTPSAGDSVGPAQGLGIMVPSDLAVAETARGAFVIVASEPSRGESGALSVMQVDGQGGLTPVDHVLDTRDSRFGGVQRVEAVTYDGHTYVVAAGGDGGVTLFEMMPDGRLVHLDSIAGTAACGLDDITALEIAVVGGELQIFAATEGEAGIVVLSAEVENRGAALAAAGGGDTVAGTARDDILMDGDGRDRLEGGAGADRYVLTEDGKVDVIAGFDPSEDILDLSGLPLLYDASRLEIARTANGARITHRDETIRLIGTDGQPLDPEAVRAAVELTVNRTFQAPSHDLEGTGAADRLVGDWGPDTLSGMDGSDTLNGGDGGDRVDGGGANDRLFGRGGADWLNGAAGNDTIFGGRDGDSLYGGSGEDRLLGGGGGDLIKGMTGGDTLRGGRGRDTIRGQGDDDVIGGGADDDRLRGNTGNDTVKGGPGRDTIRGDAGNDALYGGTWSDTILGGAGDDVLKGQKGHDLIRGGGGDDSLDGGGGADTVRGLDGKDSIAGGAGQDRLYGGKWRDTLSGEAGNDLLDGQKGKDVIRGGGGNDIAKGGRGNDLIHGGRGDDTLVGGRGADTFVFRTGGSADVIRDFDARDDTLRLDRDWRSAGMSKREFVDTHAHITDDGIELRFGNGDRVLLEGFYDMAALDEALTFV